MYLFKISSFNVQLKNCLKQLLFCSYNFKERDSRNRLDPDAKNRSGRNRKKFYVKGGEKGNILLKEEINKQGCNNYINPYV